MQLYNGLTISQLWPAGALLSTNDHGFSSKNSGIGSLEVLQSFFYLGISISLFSPPRIQSGLQRKRKYNLDKQSNIYVYIRQLQFLCSSWTHQSGSRPQKYGLRTKSTCIKVWCLWPHPDKIPASKEERKLSPDPIQLVKELPSLPSLPGYSQRMTIPRIS